MRPTLEKLKPGLTGALAATAVILGLLVFSTVQTWSRTARLIGVTVDTEVPGMQVSDVSEDGPAARAGVQPGDIVVEVGGKPITDVASYDDAADEFVRGEPVTFVVERRGDRRPLEIVPGSRAPWGRLFFRWLTTIGYLGIGWLAWPQVGRDLRACLLFFFSLAVAFEFVTPEYGSSDTAVGFLIATFFVTSGVQMALELHLASVIPERPPWLRRASWLVPTMYVFGIGLCSLIAIAVVVDFFGFAGFPLSAETANALFNRLLFPTWALLVPALLAVPALRHPDPQGRHQAGLVLAGVLPWTATSMIATAHELVEAPYPSWMEIAEPFALLCYPVAIFVAVFRYQFLDMELIVRRSLLYTALTTLLLLIFYASLGAGSVIFSEFLPGENEVWVVAIATLILGLLFTPLRRSLEAFIYRKFFPERMELRSRLVALASELPSTGNLPRMGAKLVERLGEILKIRWATLLIADPGTGSLATLASSLDLDETLEHSVLLSPEDPALQLLAQSGRPFPAKQLGARSPVLAHRLEQLKASVVVPLLTQDNLIGLLILGPKEQSESYVAEEMELLNLLAHHVAIVFENARLFESATRDSLTGFLRREAILERLEIELQRARRFGRPLSLGMADLDHFKAVNDRFGHLAGDSTLKWFSHLLRGALRNVDQVGRYGGEEFLIILPETDLEGSVTVAEKARSMIESETLIVDGQMIAVTVSIGMASLDRLPSDGGVRELLALADRSLYEAKEAGRNRVRPSVA